MQRVLLFDVNETLLDLAAIRPHFARHFGDEAVIGQWFAALLHGSLVVTLTDAYATFGELADAALETLAERRGVTLDTAARDEILNTMRALPPHPDVPPALERLRDAGFRLATLTNSPPAVLEDQMRNSGLAGFFERLLSVEPTRRFKPAPEPYHHAARELEVEPGDLRMIAAHDWDTHGALSAGLEAAYVARPGRPYHPRYRRPEIVGADMIEVAEAIVAAEG